MLSALMIAALFYCGAAHAEKTQAGKYKHAQAIADKTGRPVAEIKALRDSGMGWGEIAKKYGFKMGDLRKKKGKSAKHDGELPDNNPSKGEKRGLKNR